ncbi:4-hydroxy-tetrahydrodipicolinate synthase [Saccharicrinis aurantiacus]|uniref:4-hydroxy-tetrahydrodipicolinate synthase n=1 Tax=Saccharicrinis aurantiacus TaxID=1849719 RepID=UPI000838A827|nr:4-hydroxy-tetrahydrodipicolinate synthase [Saccharicrinis aurantiacus]
MNFSLKGSIVAIVTPFLADGSIDWDAYDKLVEFHLKNGTDGIVVCGTTSETPTLTDAEDEALIKRAVELINGRIPIIAGTGSNSTDTAVEKTQKAKDLGADAALVVVPYYNKPTQKGIYNHFQAVATNVDLPIVLYNVPSRTGAGLSPDTVAKLANDFDNIVGIKEAAGDLSYFTQIIANTAEDFIVYSGDDFLSTSANYAGADGCISVVANIIPNEFAQLMQLSMEGNVKEANKIFYKYQNLMDLLFIESNPIPVKAALAEMGLLKETYRQPLCEMDANNKELLVAEMKKVGLL